MAMRVDVNREGFERIRSASDLFTITQGDMRGPILTRVSQAHRRHERRIFATEGGESGRGRWPALSPGYAAIKRRKVPGKKILVWSGDMKDRFISASRSEYIEEFVPEGAGGTILLGARSLIATYHFQGADETRRSKPGRRTLTPRGLRRFRSALESRRTLTPAQAARLARRAAPVSAFAPKTFRWHLPRRDMVTKSPEQVADIQRSIVEWYRLERLPQIHRAMRAAQGRG